MAWKRERRGERITDPAFLAWLYRTTPEGCLDAQIVVNEWRLAAVMSAVRAVSGPSTVVVDVTEEAAD